MKHKIKYKKIFWLLFVYLVALPAIGNENSQNLGDERSSQQIEASMVIIIDDMGDNREKGEALLALPGAITYSFLPYTPFSVEQANKAHELNKEVMLHVPMDNKTGLILGPGALVQNQTEKEIKQILRGDIDSIPHVAGMNNHMGSSLTEDRKKMQVVIEEVKEHNIFFVDSLTSPNSVAWEVAKSAGVPWLARDVFLDHNQTKEYVHKQFGKAIKIAITKGYVVVIGHPYKETIDYLTEALPLLEGLGINLIKASELIQKKMPIKPEVTEMTHG